MLQCTIIPSAPPPAEGFKVGFTRKKHTQRPCPPRTPLKLELTFMLHSITKIKIALALDGLLFQQCPQPQALPYTKYIKNSY
jgi:hypothetical protein